MWTKMSERQDCTRFDCIHHQSARSEYPCRSCVANPKAPKMGSHFNHQSASIKVDNSKTTEGGDSNE